MKSNVVVIEQMIADDTLRAYAVWLKLKSRYRNGTFFRYNCNKISAVTGVSRTSIKKYIKLFLDKGWCKMHFGNLTFIGTKHFRDIYNIRLFTLIKVEGNTISEIVSNLRYEVFKNKSRQFLFLKQKHQELINPSGEDALAKYKQALRFFKKRDKGIPSMVETGGLNISLIKLGQMIKCSPATAHSLIKKKAKEGLAEIIKTPFFRVKGINCTLPGKMFFSKGNVYVPVCNKYVF